MMLCSVLPSPPRGFFFFFFSCATADKSYALPLESSTDIKPSLAMLNMTQQGLCVLFCTCTCMCLCLCLCVCICVCISVCAFLCVPECAWPSLTHYHPPPLLSRSRTHAYVRSGSSENHRRRCVPSAKHIRTNAVSVPRPPPFQSTQRHPCACSPPPLRFFFFLLLEPASLLPFLFFFFFFSRMFLCG